MKKMSVRWKKLLLAVYFVVGGTFTFELSVERVRENRELYAIVSVLAIVFDILFFKTLFSLMKKRELPTAISAVGKLFYAIFKQIGRLCEKVSDAVSPHKDKTFLEGKNERTFVFESHAGGRDRSKRRLPRLGKNASDKEKIRHEYTVFVFKKDRTISASLTPNEVGERLDTEKEAGDLFTRYNEARYTE